MTNILNSKKITRIFLFVAIIFAGLYAYILLRPISYGMAYHTNTEYMGEEFEATIKVYPNKTIVVKNSALDEIESFYYYKNGYIFQTIAKTMEEYEEEVAYINNNFEEAINTPFYASKINAFKLIPNGLGNYEVVYTCTPTTIFAILGGIVELFLIGLISISWIHQKNSKQEK